MAEIEIDGALYRIATREFDDDPVPTRITARPFTAWEATETEATAQIPLALVFQEKADAQELDLTLQLSLETAQDDKIEIKSATLQTGTREIAHMADKLTLVDPVLHLVMRTPLDWQDETNINWAVSPEEPLKYEAQRVAGFSAVFGEKMLPGTLLVLQAYKNPVSCEATDYIREFNILGKNEELTFELLFPTDIQWYEDVPDTKTRYDDAVRQIPEIMELFLKENNVEKRPDFHGDINWPQK